MCTTFIGEHYFADNVWNKLIFICRFFISFAIAGIFPHQSFCMDYCRYLVHHSCMNRCMGGILTGRNSQSDSLTRWSYKHEINTNNGLGSHPFVISHSLLFSLFFPAMSYRNTYIDILINGIFQMYVWKYTFKLLQNTFFGGRRSSVFAYF